MNRPRVPAGPVTALAALALAVLLAAVMGLAALRERAAAAERDRARAAEAAAVRAKQAAQFPDRMEAKRVARRPGAFGRPPSAPLRPAADSADQTLEGVVEPGTWELEAFLDRPPGADVVVLVRCPGFADHQVVCHVVSNRGPVSGFEGGEVAWVRGTLTDILPGVAVLKNCTLLSWRPPGRRPPGRPPVVAFLRYHDAGAPARRDGGMAGVVAGPLRAPVRAGGAAAGPSGVLTCHRSGVEDAAAAAPLAPPGLAPAACLAYARHRPR